RDSANAEANGYFRKAALFTGFGVYELDRARQMFEQALRLDPHFGKARAEYGFMQLIAVMRGLSNDPSTLYRAEAQILQGLRDDPSFSHGHTALGALYLHVGRKEQALIEIKRALQLNPREVDA